MRRIERRMTGGCLFLLALLIVIGGSAVAVFWYTVWKTDNITDRNRTAAETEHRDQIDRAARDATRALRASGTTDPAVLTALIGKHTEAPVITYDATRKKFTAEVEMSAFYDTAGLLGAGVEQIVSCEVFTYTPGTGRTWRVDVTTRATTACRPGKEIGELARRATEVLDEPNGDPTTVAEAQRVLDRARYPGRLTVRKVTHDERTTTVSALLADTTGTTDQCYLLTLPRPGNQARGRSAATPTNSC
ncbi:hypothetical protein [Streptomyces sp. NPDC004284]|uniref:hypothetical protein n=1 Tax=Streptomyces sp. NPDC004284 TaxID=3364695 RepID=UPI003688FDD8